MAAGPLRFAASPAIKTINGKIPGFQPAGDMLVTAAMITKAMNAPDHSPRLTIGLPALPIKAKPVFRKQVPLKMVHHEKCLKPQLFCQTGYNLFQPL